jgi:hypothetical protein
MAHDKPRSGWNNERAEHKAVQLHLVGWETGTGAAVWARAVSDELARHESARESYGANPNRQAWERLHSTTLMLVVAIDQVLAFEHRVRRLTGDAEVARARADFDAACPRASDLRDLVIHLDDYAVGAGRRQTGEAEPLIEDQYLETFLWWSDGGGTILGLADESLNLRRAALAAVELAEVVERVRTKCLERAEREATAARRRRYGLDP